MTDAEHALDDIRRAAEELVPALTERLGRHGLTEIEVSRGELRLRVAARGEARTASPDSAVVPTGATPADSTQPSPPAVGVAAAQDGQILGVGVAAPAVGYFVYAEGLGPGLAVTKGDAIGHVEMLGVRHDVRAPRAGTVRHLVAESGEAVEYGQVVVEIEPSGEFR
jgi:acetyl-CoA carboxylase biotin carboxyl carrier protein